MNRFKKKEQNIKTLLEIMVTTAMNCHQMADKIKVSRKVIGSYITELRFNKKIYVYEYKRTKTGTPQVYYKTGNYPDAQKLPRLTQVDYNNKFKTGKEYKILNSKAVPKPDIAAQWMFNPI